MCPQWLVIVSTITVMTNSNLHSLHTGLYPTPLGPVYSASKSGVIWYTLSVKVRMLMTDFPTWLFANAGDNLICHPLNASELEGLLMTAKTPKSSWHRCFLCGCRNLLRVKECVSTASARGTQTLEWAESCSKLDPNT